MSEDPELIDRAQKGDRAAVETLFGRYQDDLYRFSLRLMWSHEALAQDLAQDTFLTAYESLESFQGTSTFRTWLLGIAFNHYRNYVRKKKVKRDNATVLAAIDGEQCATDEVVADHQRLELFDQAFSKIAAGQREALYLRDILGCSYEETATILGISQNAVKNRVHNGRENIRLAIRGLTRPRPGKSKQDG